MVRLTWAANACGPRNLTLAIGRYTAQLGLRPRHWYGGAKARWFGVGLWSGPTPLVLWSV